ncbi:MAG: phosphatase PAP2 family protein [Rhodospirillaceae bacterium]|nr:phosphatase PAP2 family protein [Rhodospirillaceae bacterium]
MTPAQPIDTRAVCPWHLPGPRWYAGLAAAIALTVIFLDTGFARAMHGAPAWLNEAFQAITATGESTYSLVPLGLAWLVAAAAWLAQKDRGEAGEAAVALQAIGFLFVAIAGSGIATNVVKQVIGRSRPVLLDTLDYSGFHPFAFDYAFQSFPSGHANTVFAAAVALAVLAPRWRWGLMAIATLFALSRAVIAAHYLGDVIAGGALAYLTTLWLRDRMAARGWLFERTQGGGSRLRPEAAALLAIGLPGGRSSVLPGRQP